MVSHSIGNLYRSVVSTFSSLPTESQFLQEGKLTPQEFLVAGEQLTHRCPTWGWQASASGYNQSHLPPEQQFLVTRGVPCRRRISQITESHVTETEVEDGWLVTEVQQEAAPIEEIKREDPEEDENAVNDRQARSHGTDSM